MLKCCTCSSPSPEKLLARTTQEVDTKGTADDIITCSILVDSLRFPFYVGGLLTDAFRDNTCCTVKYHYPRYFYLKESHG